MDKFERTVAHVVAPCMDWWVFKDHVHRIWTVGCLFMFVVASISVTVFVSPQNSGEAVRERYFNEFTYEGKLTESRACQDRLAAQLKRYEFERTLTAYMTRYQARLYVETRQKKPEPLEDITYRPGIDPLQCVHGVRGYCRTCDWESAD